MKPWWFALLLALWPVAATAQLATSQVRSYTITGIIRDSSGAALQAQAFWVGTSYAAETNNRGQFVLVAQLPLGAHPLRMQAIGYAPVTDTIHLGVLDSLNLGTIYLPMRYMSGNDRICNVERTRTPLVRASGDTLAPSGRDSLGAYWLRCTN